MIVIYNKKILYIFYYEKIQLKILTINLRFNKIYNKKLLNVLLKIKN